MDIPTKISKRARAECQRWLEQNIQDSRVRALAGEYWQAPIVLYTGAGVSAGPREPVKGVRYGLPSWPVLLKQLAGQPEATDWPQDPWLAADRAVGLCGGEAPFKDRLRELIGSPHHYRGKGQLNGTFVSRAHTLRAVAAFCGQLTGRIVQPGQAKPKRLYFRSAANPRVHAVLTANYDCFLEAAGSNLYRNSPLRPVTALGSPAASTSRIPVFHIHGYVPHKTHQRETREPAIDKLIITRHDYEEHWQGKDVFGVTMGPQIHYLRYYTALFIGFSFTDEYVCQLLRRVHCDYLSYGERTHYALLPEELVRARGENFFRDLGVTPVVYRDHGEIPSILGQVYRAGLAADCILAGESPAARVRLPELLTMEHTPTGNTYAYSIDHVWDMLLACQNESISAGKIRELQDARQALPRQGAAR